MPLRIRPNDSLLKKGLKHLSLYCLQEVHSRRERLFILCGRERVITRVETVLIARLERLTEGEKQPIGGRNRTNSPVRAKSDGFAERKVTYHVRRQHRFELRICDALWCQQQKRRLRLCEEAIDRPKLWQFILAQHEEHAAASELGGSKHAYVADVSNLARPPIGSLETKRIAETSAQLAKVHPVAERRVMLNNERWATRRITGDQPALDFGEVKRRARPRPKPRVAADKGTRADQEWTGQPILITEQLSPLGRNSRKVTESVQRCPEPA